MLEAIILCTLAWTTPDFVGFDSVQIYHSTTSGVYGTPIKELTDRTGSMTCEAMGITVGDGQRHYFRMTAKNSDGVLSPPSAEVSKMLPLPTPPAPTPNLTFNLLNNDQLEIRGLAVACRSLKTTGSGLRRVVTCVH